MTPSHFQPHTTHHAHFTPHAGLISETWPPLERNRRRSSSWLESRRGNTDIKEWFHGQAELSARVAAGRFTRCFCAVFPVGEETSRSLTNSFPRPCSACDEETRASNVLEQFSCEARHFCETLTLSTCGARRRLPSAREAASVPTTSKDATNPVKDERAAIEAEVAH